MFGTPKYGLNVVFFRSCNLIDGYVLFLFEWAKFLCRAEQLSAIARTSVFAAFRKDSLTQLVFFSSSTLIPDSIDFMDILASESD